MSSAVLIASICPRVPPGLLAVGAGAVSVFLHVTLKLRGIFELYTYRPPAPAGWLHRCSARYDELCVVRGRGEWRTFESTRGLGAW